MPLISRSGFLQTTNSCLHNRALSVLAGRLSTGSSTQLPFADLVRYSILCDINILMGMIFWHLLFMYVVYIIGCLLLLLNSAFWPQLIFLMNLTCKWVAGIQLDKAKMGAGK